MLLRLEQEMLSLTLEMLAHNWPSKLKVPSSSIHRSIGSPNSSSPTYD